MVAITSAARLADVSALHVAVLQPFSPLGITYALPANKVKVIGQKKAQDRNPAHLSPTLINFRIHRHLTKPIRRNTMSFDITAHTVFDDFRDRIRHTGKVQGIAGIVGIEKTQIARYPNLTIQSDGAENPINPVVKTLFLVDNGKAVETLNRGEAINFFNFVEKNSDSNYRNVKSNQLWLQVYGVRQKPFSKFNSKTNEKSVVVLDATYCQRCGIVLPLRNLTIDHQKPQQGGEVEAMLRVFRAAGLTVETGSGQKNRFLQAQIAQSVGGDQNVRARGQKGNEENRYSLNLKGTIYFSILEFYKQTKNMLEMSMHHIVNLHPMCGPCNSGLRNSNVTFIFA